MFLRCVAVFVVVCSSAHCGVHEDAQTQPRARTGDDFGPTDTPTDRNQDSGVNSQADASASESRLPDRTDAGSSVAAPKKNESSMSAMKAGSTEKVDAGMKAAAAGSGEQMMARPAAPTTPVGTIQLGSENVAKEDVIAFIHFGHSNMAGRGDAPTELRPYFLEETDAHAWMYHVGAPPELAKEPYTAGDNIADQTKNHMAGPGVALLKQAVEMAPNKYFMSLGYAQSNAYCSQYLPGGLYYDAMMAAPKAIKGRVKFGAIVVMLGITEHDGGGTDPGRYSQCINTIVTSIRADLGEPDLPLLLSDYEREANGEFAVGQPIANRIIPEISKVPGLVYNSVLVPTDGLSMQGHHFDLNGHKVWTKRALDLMKEKGWFPWAQ